ncbi:unnamed protein product [Plasmodium vivax]|uniref:(malaria parasite P. vivax) hypothetical protein n=1 Tax=Plasmodium vivax TaxID=5855 RepID=A0A8S4H867_PLAVI|nr:unnamed protein product [Plasmodium vivax]
MDFSQLKQKYKFLENILNLYGEMDKPVEKKDQYEDFLNLCDNENAYSTNPKNDEKQTCRIILRNFSLCHVFGLENVMYCCSNLYVWLYFDIKKSRISNDIIKKIFELPKLKVGKWSQHFHCPYVKFTEQTHNPEDIMKLSIFNDNADRFQSMLKDRNNINDCYLKKYVLECVDIYNKTNKAYSSLQECNSSAQEYACEIITAFNSLYTSNIHNKEGIIHEFPELSSDSTLNLNDMCPVEKSEPPRVSEQTQQDTTTTRGASTALTAMVGIPPFLALIYKFTPAGKLFKFGNKKHTIITSDFDKKMENELFHVIKEDSNIKDIQPKYKIGYEPK